MDGQPGITTPNEPAQLQQNFFENSESREKVPIVEETTQVTGDGPILNLNFTDRLNYNKSIPSTVTTTKRGQNVLSNNITDRTLPMK